MVAVPLNFRSALAGICWPGIGTDAGAQLLALEFQLGRTQWLAAADLAAHQTDQLKLLLAHAVRHVPYYEKSIGADRVQAFSAGDIGLSALPVLGRNQLQEYFDALRSRHVPGGHGNIIEGQTSGSLGMPIRFLRTDLHQLFWHAINLRDHLWHQRDLAASLAAIRTKVEQGHATHDSWGGLLDAAIRTGPSHLLNIATDIADQARWLAGVQPAYLITHPSNARALALHCLEQGIGIDSLRELRTFGETVPADLEEIADRAWGARLTDTYSSEECGYIALRCPDSGNYHIQAENLIVEVLDDNGQPCAEGVVGQVVVTTLHNFAMPLIRYALGDYAEVGGPCACGRSLPTLRRILGRQRNMLVNPSGHRHWPSFPAEMWQEIAPIRQFQLIQDTVGRIEVHYVMDQPLSGSEQVCLSEALADRLGYRFDFVWIHHDAPLPRRTNAKFEDFVSRLTP